MLCTFIGGGTQQVPMNEMEDVKLTGRECARWDVDNTTKHIQRTYMNVHNRTVDSPFAYCAHHG